MAGAEEWRPVPGYKGLYEVSNRGRVRSVERTIKFKNGRKRTFEGRVLSAHLVGGKYGQVALSKKGVQSSFRVGTLVAKAFKGLVAC